MTLFAYKVVNAQGEVEQGMADATDHKALLAQLQAQGLMPIHIEPARDKTFLGIRIKSVGQVLTAKDIQFLTAELAVLLDSGLPLDRSLKVLMHVTQDKEKLHKLLQQVLDKVKAGYSLADALENQAGVFSRFYLNMIRAGEMGGNLGEVLNRLAAYYEQMIELKSTVSTALIYPAVLLLMSLVSLYVMLAFVVPQFSDLFANSGQELPFLTQIVVALAEFLSDYGIFLLLFVMLFFYTVKQQWSQPDKKKIWDRRLLHSPGIGPVLLNKEIAALTRTLGTLLGNGVAILQALGIARDTVGNQVLYEFLQEAERELKQGKTLSVCLACSSYFPPMAVQMIQMGEETGRLEEMLLRVADIYDKQLRVTISRALALLEPALIITLGLIIAGIIISILLAILSVNDLAF